MYGMYPLARGQRDKMHEQRERKACKNLQRSEFINQRGNDKQGANKILILKKRLVDQRIFIL